MQLGMFTFEPPPGQGSSKPISSAQAESLEAFRRAAALKSRAAQAEETAMELQARANTASLEFPEQPALEPVRAAPPLAQQAVQPAHLESQPLVQKPLLPAVQPATGTQFLKSESNQPTLQEAVQPAHGSPAVLLDLQPLPKPLPEPPLEPAEHASQPSLHPPPQPHLQATEPKQSEAHRAVLGQPLPMLRR